MFLLFFCIGLAAPPNDMSSEPVVVSGCVRRVRVDVVVASIDPAAAPELELKALAMGHVVTGSTAPISSAWKPSVPGASIVDQQRFLKVLTQAQQKGWAKILVRRAIVTTSGRIGSDEQGTKVPFLAEDEKGEVKVNYLLAGTSVTVIPTIRKNAGTESIHLEVSTACSGFTRFERRAPGLSSRSTRLAFVLTDGQTACVGGGRSSLTTAVTTKMPILGDLPLIGRFFRSTRNEERQEEYLTLVTVHILDPAQDPTAPKCRSGPATVDHPPRKQRQDKR